MIESNIQAAELHLIYTKYGEFVFLEGLSSKGLFFFSPGFRISACSKRSNPFWGPRGGTLFCNNAELFPSLRPFHPYHVKVTMVDSCLWLSVQKRRDVLE